MWLGNVSAKLEHYNVTLYTRNDDFLFLLLSY